jgi:hypothetical protein
MTTELEVITVATECAGAWTCRLECSSTGAASHPNRSAAPGRFRGADRSMDRRRSSGAVTRGGRANQTRSGRRQRFGIYSGRAVPHDGTAPALNDDVAVLVFSGSGDRCTAMDDNSAGVQIVLATERFCKQLISQDLAGGICGGHATNIICSSGDLPHKRFAKRKSARPSSVFPVNSSLSSISPI